MMKLMFQRLLPVFISIIRLYYRLRILCFRNKKIALCCIVKCENDYLKEFVNYYKRIGVDKIFIYDNNNIDGERIEDVLSDEILDGFCCIKNLRGKSICQLYAYQDCYDTHMKEFDWFVFCDCDEFLTLNEFDSVKNYLNQIKFRFFHIIHINWMVYGDNDLLVNDHRNVTERFTRPVLPYDFKRQYDIPENNHIKSLIRGNLSDISWSVTPHTPISRFYRCCDASGKKCDPNSPFTPFDYSCAYFRHYYTKTIDEWIRIKQKRGYPDQTYEDAEKKLGLDTFFRINRWTKEKQEIVDKYMRL